MTGATPAHFSGPVSLSLRSQRRFEMLDITPGVTRAVAGAGIAEGAVHLFCPHTSCGLAVNELEDGFHEDLEAVLDELAPVGRPWAHDDPRRRWQNLEPDERPNGWSHVRALLATQPALVLPISEGALAIGRWQRLFLVELDGGRERTVTLRAWGRPA